MYYVKNLSMLAVMERHRGEIKVLGELRLTPKFWETERIMLLRDSLWEMSITNFKFINDSPNSKQT